MLTSPFELCWMQLPHLLKIVKCCNFKNTYCEMESVLTLTSTRSMKKVDIPDRIARASAFVLLQLRVFLNLLFCCKCQKIKVS